MGGRRAAEAVARGKVENEGATQPPWTQRRSNADVHLFQATDYLRE